MLTLSDSNQNTRSSIVPGRAGVALPVIVTVALGVEPETVAPAKRIFVVAATVFAPSVTVSDPPPPPLVVYQPFEPEPLVP